MNDQEELFSYRSVGDIEVPVIPASRRTDPATSRAAARSMAHGAAKQRAQIVSLMADGKRRNHTQIDAALEWPHPTAARRLAELRRAGFLVVVGYSKTDSGRLAQDYRITARGREVAA